MVYNSPLPKVIPFILKFESIQSLQNILDNSRSYKNCRRRRSTTAVPNYKKIPHDTAEYVGSPIFVFPGKSISNVTIMTDVTALR